MNNFILERETKKLIPERFKEKREKMFEKYKEKLLSD